MKPAKPEIPLFAVFVNNTEYPAFLELHKIYRVIADDDASQDGDIRVIDESGEDYLYPAGRFAMLELPQAVKDSHPSCALAFARCAQRSTLLSPSLVPIRVTSKPNEGHAVRADEVRYHRHDGAAGEVEFTDIGGKGCVVLVAAPPRRPRMRRPTARPGWSPRKLCSRRDRRPAGLGDGTLRTPCRRPSPSRAAAGRAAATRPLNTSCPSPWSSSRTSPEGVRIDRVRVGEIELTERAERDVHGKGVPDPAAVTLTVWLAGRGSLHDRRADAVALPVERRVEALRKTAPLVKTMSHIRRHGAACRRMCIAP